MTATKYSWLRESVGNQLLRDLAPDSSQRFHATPTGNVISLLNSGHNIKLISMSIFGRCPAKLGPKTPFKGVRLDKWCSTHPKSAQETNSDAIS